MRQERPHAGVQLRGLMLQEKAQIAVSDLLGVKSWLADGEGQEGLTWGWMLYVGCTLVALLDATQSAACADFAGVVQALVAPQGCPRKPAWMGLASRPVSDPRPRLVRRGWQEAESGSGRW